MFLDFGLGILAALLTSALFGIEPTWMLIAFGVVVCLWPDADALFHMRARKELGGHRGHEHRNLFHYPLLYIPLGTALISLFSLPYAALFALGSFLHFLHDSIGIGWGVQWLYPLKRRYYAFFYHYDVFRHRLPKRAVYAWTQAEVDQLSDRYGDADWIRNIYFRWHPYAIVEFAGFAVALAVLWRVMGE